MWKGLQILLVVGLCLGIVSITHSQGEEKWRLCGERFGYWNEDSQLCTFTPRLTYTVSYPVELVDDPVLMQAVDEFIETEIQSYNIAFLEYPNSYRQNFPWYLDIRYEIFDPDATVISIRFDSDVYSGGVHPNHYFQTFVFNRTSEKIWAIEDLFAENIDPWTTIATIAQAQLLEQLPPPDEVQNWVSEGAGANPDNFRDFVIDGDVLLIYFEAYQVASYGDGAHVVVIPLADIQSLLDPALFPQAE